MCSRRLPWSRVVTAVGLLIAGLVLAQAGHADTVAVEPAKDNTLFNTGTTSNGSGPVLFSGQTGGLTPTIQRAVLKFGLCEIPRGSTVTSAELTIYLERSLASGQIHTIHRLLADWGEGASSTAAGDGGGGGMGVPAELDDATWLVRFFPNLPWITPGGDFSALASASQSVTFNFGSPPIAHVWGSTPEMIADVQAWVDDPATNFGWLMRGDESSMNTAKRFASREAIDPAIRPALVVEFTPPPSPCQPDCANGPADGVVDTVDLLDLLAGWGLPCQGCDLDCNGTVDTIDLLDLLAAWGNCP